MKKLILSGIFAVGGLTATANAQIQKGNWMVGSSLFPAISDLIPEHGYNIKFSRKELILLKIM